MNTMDTNMYLADYYLSRLNDLSNKAKLYIVKKLADSLMSGKEDSAMTKEDAAALLDKINGAWADDGISAEEEIRTLRADHRQGLTRNIEAL